MSNYLELNGYKWKNVTGQAARCSNDKVLGKITDQFVDDGKMVFMINGEYEVVASDVDSIVYPETFIRITE